MKALCPEGRWRIFKAALISGGFSGSKRSQMKQPKGKPRIYGNQAALYFRNSSWWHSARRLSSVVAAVKMGVSVPKSREIDGVRKIVPAVGGQLTQIEISVILRGNSHKPPEAISANIASALIKERMRERNFLSDVGRVAWRRLGNACVHHQ